MAVRSQTYMGNVHGIAVFIPDLVYVKIICVHRKGTEYDIITTGDPNNREVLYVSGSGELRFKNLFEGSDTSVGLGLFQSKEKIHVIWEE